MTKRIAALILAAMCLLLTCACMSAESETTLDTSNMKKSVFINDFYDPGSGLSYTSEEVEGVTLSTEFEKYDAETESINVILKNEANDVIVSTGRYYSIEILIDDEWYILEPCFDVWLTIGYMIREGQNYTQEIKVGDIKEEYLIDGHLTKGKYRIVKTYNIEEDYGEDGTIIDRYLTAEFTVK